MNKEIEKEISNVLRDKGKYSKALAKELYQSYLDEETSLMEQGLSEREAKHGAKEALEASLGTIEPGKGKPYIFPILISAFFFLLTFGELIIANVSSSIASPLLRYVLIESLFALGWLIYGICTHRKRRTLDYVVLSVIFISLFISLIETSLYAYASDTGNRVWEYGYIYPCIFKAILHNRNSSGGMGEVLATHSLFYPQAIVSFASLVISSTVCLTKRSKKPKKNK